MLTTLAPWAILILAAAAAVWAAVENRRTRRDVAGMVAAVADIAAAVGRTPPSPQRNGGPGEE